MCVRFGERLDLQSKWELLCSQKRTRYREASSLHSVGSDLTTEQDRYIQAVCLGAGSGRRAMFWSARLPDTRTMHVTFGLRCRPSKPIAAGQIGKRQVSKSSTRSGDKACRRRT